MTTRILVIGGGIGGLSAAIGLKKKGFDVEVWERNESTKVYHVGIIVQGNFLGALDLLGIADKAVAAGYPYETFDFYNMDGTHLHPGPTLRIVERFPPYLGITRPALHKVLLDEVVRLGVPLHLGCTFASMDDRKEEIAVTSTKGETKCFDLVIGADGVTSSTRKLVAGPSVVPEFADMAVWRYNFKRLPEVTGLKVYKNKPGQMAGLVPLTEDTMYIFIVCHAHGNPRIPQSTMATELRKKMEGYGGPIASIIDQVTDADLVVYRPLDVLMVNKPWHKGRIVLLGDAAHATTPTMGQGAALAVEDAAVLADELSKQGSLDSALLRYTERRFDRARQVVEASLAIGKHELSPTANFNPQEVFGQVYKTLAQPL